MKRLFNLLAVALITASTFAQAPEKMSYQTIMRDASGALVTDQEMQITLSILRASVGTEYIAYRETHSTKTNSNGLLSLKIGSGVVNYGLLSAIDWKNGPYLIKTETAIDGETITNTSDFYSVAYAFHAHNTVTVNGKRVLTEVPEGAVFTDDQTAKDIVIDPISNLPASHLQGALEELRYQLGIRGDMEKSVYDTDNDGMVDNAAKVNGLTIETAVPADAVFTDNQKGNEISLTKIMNIGGTDVTTVEAAIIKLQEELISLQEQIK